MFKLLTILPTIKFYACIDILKEVIGAFAGFQREIHENSIDQENLGVITAQGSTQYILHLRVAT